MDGVGESPHLALPRIVHMFGNPFEVHLGNPLGRVNMTKYHDQESLQAAIFLTLDQIQETIYDYRDAEMPWTVCLRALRMRVHELAILDSYEIPRKADPKSYARAIALAREKAAVAASGRPARVDWTKPDGLYRGYNPPATWEATPALEDYLATGRLEEGSSTTEPPSGVP